MADTFNPLAGIGAALQGNTQSHAYTGAPVVNTGTQVTGGGGGYVDPFKGQSIQSPLIPQGTVSGGGGGGGGVSFGGWSGNTGGGGSTINPASDAINTQAVTATAQVAINQQLASRSAELGRSLSQQEIMQYAGSGYVNQQQGYYGNKNNLTPDQQAYYGKVQTGEIQFPSSQTITNIPAQTLSSQQLNSQVQQSEQLYQKQISSANGVPVYQIRVKDSSGNDRIANQDEMNYFNKQTMVYGQKVSKTQGMTIFGKDVSNPIKGNQDYQNVIYGIDKTFSNIKSSPIGQFVSMGVAGTKELSRDIGASALPWTSEQVFGTPAQQQAQFADMQSKFGVIAKISEPILKTELAIGKYLYEDIQAHPIKNIILFGAPSIIEGAGVAFGVAKTAIKGGEIATYLRDDLGLLKPTANIIEREIATGVFSFPKTKVLIDEATGEIKYGANIGKTLKLGVGGAFVGYVAYKDISTSSTPYEAIGKLAVSAKDIYLFTKPFVAGEKYITEPIITREIPQMEVSKYLEKQKLFVKGEKYDTLSRYKIETDIYPKQVEISTRAKVLLEQEPIKELSYVKKPYKLTSVTPFQAKSGEAFSVIGYGERYKDISIISGTAENTELRSLYPKQLSAIDKRLVQELALGEEWKLKGNKLVPTKGLRDVSNEMVLKNLPKDAMYQYGNIEKEKLWTSQKGFVQEGRRLTYTRYLGKFEELPVAEGGKFDATKGEIVFKDITKPFSRSSGRIQRMEGLTIRNKEPIRIDTTANFDFKPNEIRANMPFDYERKVPSVYDEPLMQTQKAIQIPKLEPRVPAPPKVRLVSMSREVKAMLKEPTAVRTRTSLARQGAVQQTARNFGQLSSLNVDSKLLNSVSMKDMTKLTSQEKYLTMNMEKTLSKELSKELTKEVAKEQTKLQERQLSKLQEKLLTKQMERYLEKPPYQPPTKKTIYTPPFKEVGDLAWSTIGKARGRTPLKSFDVGIVKKGKGEIIGKGVSFNLAEDLGSSRVMKDLSATFFIRPSKEPLTKTGSTGFFKEVESMFRKPKSSSKYSSLGTEVLIQKERVSAGGRGRGRLTSKSERSAIQQAKINNVLKHLR